MNEDQAIQDLRRKITRERAIIVGLNQMRQATNNAQVNSRVESQIRDASRNIQYFEQTLQDLETRKMGGSMSDMSLQGNGGPTPPQKGGQQRGTNNQQGYGGQGGDYGTPGPGGYSMGGGNGLMPPKAPYAPPGPSDRSPRARPNYSKLGMCVMRAS